MAIFCRDRKVSKKLNGGSKMKLGLFLITTCLLASGSAGAYDTVCSGKGTFSKSGEQSDVRVVVSPQPHGLNVSLTTEKGTRTWAIASTQPFAQPYPWGTQYLYPGDFLLKVYQRGTADFTAYYPSGNQLDANGLNCGKVASGNKGP
jgi:hypothetical protein